MITCEVTGANKIQREHLRSKGQVERLDGMTTNVTVEDSEYDDLTDWLEDQNLEYRMI